MSDFKTDLPFALENEDSQQLHAIVPDDPPGSYAISGINSHSFPEQFKKIVAIPQSQRGPAVDEFYEEQFWNSYQGQLSDLIEKRILDEEINAGMKEGIIVLQKAINDCGVKIDVDGYWGPKTVMAANSLDQNTLLNSIRKERLQYYKDIVAANPAKAKYLGTEQHPGPWWIRALK